MEERVKDQPPPAESPVPPSPGEQQDSAKPPRVAPPASETPGLSG